MRKRRKSVSAREGRLEVPRGKSAHHITVEGKKGKPKLILKERGRSIPTGKGCVARGKSAFIGKGVQPARGSLSRKGKSRFGKEVLLSRERSIGSPPSAKKKAVLQRGEGGEALSSARPPEEGGSIFGKKGMGPIPSVSPLSGRAGKGGVRGCARGGEKRP